MDSVTKPGEILSDRYLILRHIGEDQLVNTYVSEDIKLFHEQCILQEFLSPLPDGYGEDEILELFEQEAADLFKLKHPQIARLREVFVWNEWGQKRLFLAQDYIHGSSYRQLLKARRQEGLGFTEADMLQLLAHILPPLQYLHNQGVIHQNITSESIILRYEDCLPVLTDFGAVRKNIKTIITPQGNGDLKSTFATSLTTPYPYSDLYALGVTIVSLLQGKTSFTITDFDQNSHNWQREISLSPTLNGVLQKMLAHHPDLRFQSAQEVLQALDYQLVEPVIPSSMANLPPSTLVNEELYGANSTPVSLAQPSPPASKMSILLDWLSKLTLFSLVVVISGLIGWFAGKGWIKHFKAVPNNSSSSNINVIDAPSLNKVPSSNDVPESPPDEESLNQLRLNLGLDEEFYEDLVNQLFWEKYPSQADAFPQEEEENNQWRVRRQELAAEVLRKLSMISLDSLAGVGSYTNRDSYRWVRGANKLRLSSNSLFDLVDAEFFYLFPEQKEKQQEQGQQQERDFLSQPIGQIWYAIAFEQLKSLQEGETYAEIEFSPEQTKTKFSGTLSPGKGKAYVAFMERRQIMNFRLTTSQKTLLSIYSPTGRFKILEDSQQTQWSGRLPENGYYEFVIISPSPEMLNYELGIELKDSSSPGAMEGNFIEQDIKMLRDEP